MLDFLLDTLKAAEIAAPFSQNYDGFTPAHLATLVGSASCLESLLSQGYASALAATDRRGRTPAHLCATCAPSAACARVLCRADGAACAVCGKRAQQPLHDAVESHAAALPPITAWDDVLLAFLVSSGVPVNAENGDGHTALELAVLHNDPRAVALVAGCNSTDTSLHAPLQLAIREHRRDCVGALCACHRLSVSDLSSALLLAAGPGWFPSAVEMLLQLPAVTASKDTLTEALYAAVCHYKDDWSVCLLLLRAGATPTPSFLALAVDRDNAALLEASATFCSSLPETAKYASSLLHKSQSAAVARALVCVLGADALHVSADGRTAVAAALRNGHFAAASWLLEQSGVDVNCVDADGHDAIFYAASYQHEPSDILPRLLCAGASPLQALHPLAAVDDVALLEECASAAAAAGLNLLGKHPRNLSGEQPIHCVLSARAAVLLLQLGADVNSVAEGTRETPLISALRRRAVGAAAWLAARPEVTLGAVDARGRNALYWALAAGPKELASTLVKTVVTCLGYSVGNVPEAQCRGVTSAVLTDVTDNGWAAIHLLFAHPQLLPLVADSPHVRKEWWETKLAAKYSAVHLAAHCTDTRLLRKLIDLGVNPRYRSTEDVGYTPYEAVLHHVPQFAEAALMLGTAWANEERRTAAAEQLFTTHILKHIFSFLSVNDLNLCAVTCKHWRDVATRCNQYAQFVPSLQAEPATKMISEWRVAAVDFGSRWGGWLQVMGDAPNVYCAIIRTDTEELVAARPEEWKQELLENGVRDIAKHSDPLVPGMVHVGHNHFIIDHWPTVKDVWEAKGPNANLLALCEGHVVFLWFNFGAEVDLWQLARFIREKWTATGRCCTMWGKLMDEMQVAAGDTAQAHPAEGQEEQQDQEEQEGGSSSYSSSSEEPGS
eukprot:TRINITY_DN4174_c0_g1_i3.p1 TRINITY_DN4174_c0_g1~~TRINITY_DN4174_c0_g1_i3.p1  ORF type:complete len:895 (+),score=162.09 TRINITY_DN4174_c0_g1_i3:641-3325(+)